MKESRMEQSRHELLSDVADLTATIVADHGLSEDRAEQIGCAVANRIAEHWGGQLINIPKDYLFKLSQRDLQIYEDFNGTNHPDLARKYGVGVRAIYKIIKRVSKRETDRRQVSLF